MTSEEHEFRLDRADHQLKEAREEALLRGLAADARPPERCEELPYCPTCQVVLMPGEGCPCGRFRPA